jgi:hypothetical protein
MLYRILADVVLLIHFAFVIFTVSGALLAYRWRWVIALHLPAALWAAYIEFSGGICPLTPLENSLRVKSGAAGYAGGFIGHYLLPILYPAGLTRDTQIMLGIAVLIINLAIYWRLFRPGHR